MYCFSEVKGATQTPIFQLLCILHILLTYFITKMGQHLRRPVKSTTCGLPEARSIFGKLPPDLQTQIVKDYILPELEAHSLCKEFKSMVITKFVNKNDIWYDKYIHKLRLILANDCALKIMRANDEKFEDSYYLHFILKKKAFDQIDCFIKSMAVHIERMNN